MKTLVILIVIFAIVAMLGIGGYTLSQNSSQSDSMVKKDDNAMGNDHSVSSEQEKVKDDTKVGSRYVEYSKDALDSAANTRRVLFFYASWCPTCQPADADFKENVSRIPEDVTLIRVNYNDPETDQEEKELAKKYGLTYQHTFVQIDSTGKEKRKWNGGQIDTLLANIK